MAFRKDLYPDEYFERLHRVTPFAAPQRKWRERDRDILSLAKPSPEKTALDLGSALGDVCFLLAPLVKEAIGVDASPHAIELAERRRRERGLENVRFLRADVADLAGVADRSVDVAGAFDLLEHVDDETVRRMLRALRRPREIRELLEEEGWRVRSIRYSPAPFPVVRWIERALWRLPLIGRFFRYRILAEATPDPAVH